MADASLPAVALVAVIGAGALVGALVWDEPLPSEGDARSPETSASPGDALAGALGGVDPQVRAAVLELAQGLGKQRALVSGDGQPPAKALSGGDLHELLNALRAQAGAAEPHALGERLREVMQHLEKLEAADARQGR